MRITFQHTIDMTDVERELPPGRVVRTVTYEGPSDLLDLLGVRAGDAEKRNALRAGQMERELLTLGVDAAVAGRVDVEPPDRALERWRVHAIERRPWAPGSASAAYAWVRRLRARRRSAPRRGFVQPSDFPGASERGWAVEP